MSHRKIQAAELRKLLALKAPTDTAYDALQDATIEHQRLKASYDGCAVKYLREGRRLVKKYGMKDTEEINLDTGAIQQITKPEAKKPEPKQVTRGR